MKRLLPILIWGAISAGCLYYLNCARPLDITEADEMFPDTIFVSDTVTFTDTLYSDTTFIDTLIIDTLIVDTLYIDTTIVDTVYIDSLFCARLGSHRQEIVWMLFNQEGLYRLEFQATAERIRRPQILVIDIDHQQYQWNLSTDLDFIMELNLENHATIRITSVPPHAYGQSIDICLRARAI